MFPDARLLPVDQQYQLVCLTWLDGAVCLCIALAMTDLVFRVPSGLRVLLVLIAAATTQTVWLLTAMELFGETNE